MNRAALCTLATLIAACSTDALPTADPALTSLPAGGDPHLIVYSQNVYVGTDVDQVLSAPADELQQRLFDALGKFAATNWPERAAAIAEHIVATRPDLVALNEVSNLSVQGLTPFFPDLDVDFLPILMAALEARGGGYVIAGRVANVDAQVDLGGPAIRLRDYDVVLARADVRVANVISRNYGARVTVPLGGLGAVDLVRGYVQVDATVHGRTVRFVATHLEPQETSLPLQLAQSAELIAALDGAPFPVVVAGDLNSDPLDAAALTSYDQLAAAGFQDAWLNRVGPRNENGFTCCTSASLRDPVASHRKRIDLILARPTGPARGAGIVPVRFGIFGDDVTERTSSGMWPSDHAGVSASIPWRQLDGQARTSSTRRSES